MSTFAFRAVDVAGIPSRGELEAPTKAQVTEQLRARGLIVLDVSERHEAFKIESIFQRFKSVDQASPLGLLPAVRDARRLGDAAAPLPLHPRGPDGGRDADAAIESVRADVEAGSSLHQAMERQPGVFDPLYRSMVRSGEESGKLEEALDRVAYQLEKLDALRRQVKSAMMYPAVVFGVALLVMIAICAFVVPVFVGIFKDLAAENPTVSAELPTLTQITVSVSNVVTKQFYLLIPGMAAVAYGFVRWKKTEEGRMQWDSSSCGSRRSAT